MNHPIYRILHANISTAIPTATRGSRRNSASTIISTLPTTQNFAAVSQSRYSILNEPGTIVYLLDLVMRSIMYMDITKRNWSHICEETIFLVALILNTLMVILFLPVVQSIGFIGTTTLGPNLIVVLFTILLYLVQYYRVRRMNMLQDAA